jgi:fibronectin type 3 domain-containing protein
VAAAPGSLQATVSWNAATGATGYNVKRSATSGSGYTTLGSSPTATASPYVDVGLTSGTTYFYVVSSVNTVATCESANSTVGSAIPTGPTCTPPPAPTATAIASNGQVTLTWTASTGATSYAIARSVTSGTGYATIQVASVGTTFSDLNVVNGTTYYYVITASNGTCSSGNSAEVSAAPTCTPPAAPTGIVATPNNGAVALAWTAPTGAVSYRVLRSTTSGSGYLMVGTSSTPAFTDATVANGTTYYYVIAASNGSCNSVNSVEVPAAPLCVPPSVPTGVTATPGNKQVVLAWTASTGGATLYRVSRGTAAAGPFTSIATPAGIGYTDIGVTNGTTYYYVVSASNGSCNSANTVAISATPVCTPPSVPGTLVATPGDTQVALTWAASAPAPTSYSVGRSTVSGGPYTSVATPTVTSYTNIGLTDGVTYFFVVSASNGTCSSANSAEKSATPAFVCTQAAPTGLVATAGNKQVSLTWTAAVGATSYGIARSTISGTGYVSVGSVNAPATAFVDTDPALVNGTTYYYVVSASSTCTSVNSAEASAKPVCTPPPPPAGVVATNNNANGQITVTWNTSAGATAYTVSRNTAATGTFTPISTNQTAATFTEPAALTPGNTYFYEVSASNASGTCASANSTPAVSAMSCTLPVAPTGLSARRSGNKQVTLVWTNSSGATSYNVLRSTTSGSGYTSLATPAGSPYVDNAATNATAFFYVVTARSDAGGNCSSANSAEVSVPACTVWASGIHSQQLGASTAEWCVVTCADISSGGGFAQPFNCHSRTAYFNGAQATCGTNIITPAKANGGYAFYFTAATDGGFVGAQIGNATDATCAP